MQIYYEVVLSWTGGRNLDLKYRTSLFGAAFGPAENGDGSGSHTGDVIRACGGPAAEERIQWTTVGSRDDAMLVGSQPAGSDDSCPISATITIFVWGDQVQSTSSISNLPGNPFNFELVPPPESG
eukprot:jgi/Ulvmu1/8812/UM048_0067.1